MWLKRSIDSQTNNPNTMSKRMRQFTKQMKRQAELVPYENAEKKIALLEIVRVVEDSQQVAWASDW
eukprot:11151985-Prorocentrum_lima.AAC.1